MSSLTRQPNVFIKYIQDIVNTELKPVADSLKYEMVDTDEQKEWGMAGTGSNVVFKSSENWKRFFGGRNNVVRSGVVYDKLLNASDRLQRELEELKVGEINDVLDSIQEVQNLSADEIREVRKLVMEDSNKYLDRPDALPYTSEERFRNAVDRTHDALQRDMGTNFFKTAGHRIYNRIGTDKRADGVSFYKRMRLLMHSELSRTGQRTQLFALKAAGYEMFTTELAPNHYEVMKKWRKRWPLGTEICEVEAGKPMTYAEAFRVTPRHPLCICRIVGYGEPLRVSSSDITERPEARIEELPQEQIRGYEDVGVWLEEHREEMLNDIKVRAREEYAKRKKLFLIEANKHLKERKTYAKAADILRQLEAMRHL